MKKISILLILAMAIVSGCVQDKAESVHEKQEDHAGQDLLTDHDGRREGDGPNFARDRDSDMRMSEQNPNLLNTDNENRVNFSQDVRKAKQVISDQGYQPDSIWINGGTLNVNASSGNRLSRKEMAQAEKELRNSLVRALPRYEINVEIQ